MAYVVAICGAGGKTTLCFEKAKYYQSMGKSVAVTTTTHMYNEDYLVKYEDLDFNHIDKSKIYFVATPTGDMVKSLSPEQYDELCKHFDIVIVEADGSKSMPMKIIKGSETEDGRLEPNIPDNANEIIVVMGKQAIGRKLKTVCHNFDKYEYRLVELNNKDVTGDTLVTEDLLNDFAKVFYVDYLRTNYSNAKIDIYLFDILKTENYKNYKKIAFAVAAAGFSKRFGENKLFYKVNGRALYQRSFDLITEAISLIVGVRLILSVAFITQYDLEFSKEELKKISSLADFKIIYNPHPEIGMSESIKIATNEFIDYDAICYLNADMPCITPKSLANMIINFIHSNKGIGAMCVDSVLKNPAIFSKKYYDEILEIEGDNGPRALLTKYVKDCYFYHIDKVEMVDLDVKNL